MAGNDALAGVCEPAPEAFLLRACSFLKWTTCLRFSSDPQRQPGLRRSRPLPAALEALREQLRDMRAGSGWLRGPQALLGSPPGRPENLHLNFARAAPKVTLAVSINKKKGKKEKGERRKGARRRGLLQLLPLKLEYSSRCFCFRPVLLSLPIQRN